MIITAFGEELGLIGLSAIPRRSCSSPRAGRARRSTGRVRQAARGRAVRADGAAAVHRGGGATRAAADRTDHTVHAAWPPFLLSNWIIVAILLAISHSALAVGHRPRHGRGPRVGRTTPPLARSSAPRTGRRRAEPATQRTPSSRPRPRPPQPLTPPRTTPRGRLATEVMSRSTTRTDAAERGTRGEEGARPTRRRRRTTRPQNRNSRTGRAADEEGGNP
ncbi:hypothetical protein QJS66_11660 [Kocuria rhizophila]|nr:hypothetical protein QJS66_11660 [Kocuria rhizophila]